MTQVIDNRDAMANQLLMRGHATILELMTVSFGEWPPKGLDVNTDVFHDFKVEIKPFLDAKGGNKGQATVEWNGDRIIKIQKETAEKHSALHSVMGHEAVHIMQTDHSHMLEIGASAPLPLAAGEKKKGNNNILSRLMDKLFDSSQKADQHLSNQLSAEKNPMAASTLIMDELMGHKKQTGGPVSLYTSHNIGKYVSYLGSSNAAVYEQLLYLRQGAEVQARLHQVMIDGYQRWGKLPANQDEFLAAIKNAGIKLPKEIETHLNGLPGNSSARHFLNAKPGLQTQVILDIQQVSNSLMADSRLLLWNKSMPAMYADLIEMYGDKPGRERFGLGKNPKAEGDLKFSKAPIKNNPTTAPIDTTSPSAKTGGTPDTTSPAKKPNIPSPG
jgi:hypothetical protein